MKPVSILSLVVILLSTLAGCNRAPEQPSSTATPTGASWDDRSIFSSGLVQAAQPILNTLPNASVYHIQLQIDADMIHISGQEQVRYTNAEDTALNQIDFRLFPNILGGTMEISSVRIDSQTVEPSYSMGNSVMSIEFSKPLQPGEKAILEIDFRATVPETVDENYGVLAYVNGILALAHAYPMIPVYDQQGWNVEVPPEYGDLTFADMAFFVVQVTAPGSLQLVAVGREVSKEKQGDNQVVTYAAGPVRDFYLAASADYQMITDRAGETTINFYAPKDNMAGAQDALAYAARAVQDFSERYAPYPYTELDLVGTPTQALGIEYPGMIAITNRVLVPGQDYLEGTVAHEVAHQWFYNLVGSDQLDQPWMDESLAQFVTLQYFSDKYGAAGEQGFRQSLTSRWDSVNDAPIPIGKPVAAYTGQEYSAIVYGRGGLFFEALRDKMGGEAFDRFMKDYTTSYSWRIAYPADLESKAEADCSCALSGLFQEWVSP
jgi:aminopeptidase N